PREAIKGLLHSAAAKVWNKQTGMTRNPGGHGCKSGTVECQFYPEGTNEFAQRPNAFVSMVQKVPLIFFCSVKVKEGRMLQMRQRENRIGGKSSPYSQCTLPRSWPIHRKCCHRRSSFLN